MNQLKVKFNVYVFDTIRMIILCSLIIKCDFRIMTSLKVEASLQRMYHVFKYLNMISGMWPPVPQQMYRSLKIQFS